MNKKQYYGMVLLISSILAPFILLVTSTKAADNGQSFTISPPIFELKANPGDRLEETVSVYNSNSYDLPLVTTVENLKPMGEKGQVQVIGGSDEGLPTLKEWIKINTVNFTVTKGGTKNVTFSINVPSNAEPGGHFATVLFGTTSSSLEGSGSQVSQKIGTLVLLTVAGTTQEAAEVTQFAPEKTLFWRNQAINFNLKIYNSGNVYVRPRGYMVITNIFGNKVAQIEIDDKNILPTAVRDIPQEYKPKFLFGPYTASLALVYGNSNQNINATCGFWVIPWLQTSIGLIVLILLFLLRRRLWKAIKIIFGKDKK